MKKLWKFLCDGEGFRFEFSRYALVGFTSTIIDFAVLFGLTEWIGMYYLYSAAYAFTIGVIVSYFLSTKWAFKQRKIQHRGKEFLIYVLIGVVGLLLTEVGMFWFTEFFAVYYLLSKLIVELVVYSWNFFMRKFVLFCK